MIEDAIKKHFAKDESPSPDKKVAQRSKISLTTVWRWKKTGNIGSVLVAGEKRVRVRDLEDFFEDKWLVKK